MKRIVVTGMGVVSPLGLGVERVWKRLIEGQSGIQRIESMNTDDLPCKIAGVVPRGEAAGELNISSYVTAPEYRRIDDFMVYAIAAAQEAFESSGLNLATEEQRERAGVLIGSGIGAIGNIADTALVLHEKGPRRISPYFIPKSLINEASGYISIRHGLKGPCHAVVTACATGANAIGDAARLIQFGDADVMLAGGTEAPIHRLTIAGFTVMRAMSTHFNATPTEASRPWDTDRDGFVAGEGAGVLVLESLEHAQNRGATILAELKGYGLSGDGYHLTSPDPDGAGAFRAIRSALQHAKVNPDEIDYVNAHATSTPAGDFVELSALERLVGAVAQDSLAVSSTKSATGHLLGAAGAVEAAFAIMALRSQSVPPTLNLHKAERSSPFNLVPMAAQDRKIRNVVSNSFGFGGTNAALVFGLAP